MKLPMRTLAVLLCVLLSAMPVIAQQYPGNRPIKILAPLPPGASTDTLARMLAPLLEKRLGQTVIVENRPGVKRAIATFGATPIGGTLQEAQATAQQEIDSLKEAVRLGIFKPRQRICPEFSRAGGD